MKEDCEKRSAPGFIRQAGPKRSPFQEPALFTHQPRGLRNQPDEMQRQKVRLIDDFVLAEHPNLVEIRPVEAVDHFSDDGMGEITGR